MGFRVKVLGVDNIYLDETIIQNMEVNMIAVGTKNDKPYSTMWVSGKLTSSGDNQSKAVSQVIAAADSETGTTESNSSTVKLFEWSLVPGTNADAYRDVVVEVIENEQALRTINFPKAFVIDYSEKYSSTAGTGEFGMKLRQRDDKTVNLDP